jgi:capsular polysaccharide biosynthesis protein
VKGPPTTLGSAVTSAAAAARSAPGSLRIVIPARRLFAACGIPEDDIVTVDRPVYLNSVTSATPMWHNNEPYYVHPDLAAVWRRLGAALIDRGAVTYDGIFVSRGGHLGHRACRNALEVERFFGDRGFTIVHPEPLDLGRQQAVIAGFGGSAMFNLTFAENVKSVILLSHEAYTARNEHQFASLIGGDIHYFWSAPDVPHPDEAWSHEAFYSAWEFDFARNRGPLQNAIDTL